MLPSEAGASPSTYFAVFLYKVSQQPDCVVVFLVVQRMWDRMWGRLVRIRAKR